MDHQNIRIGTYGGDFITAIPAGPGQIDLLGWGVLQNGQWGYLNQHSGAYTVEGGYQLTHVASTPWLRGGWYRGTGDNNPNDTKHGTFVELLPTPRGYARFPIYNLMNLEDGFVQLIDRPNPKWELRSDLHWLQLTSPHDLWYQGGGPFDNKVAGYTGRPQQRSFFLSHPRRCQLRLARQAVSRPRCLLRARRRQDCDRVHLSHQPARTDGLSRG